MFRFRTTCILLSLSLLCGSLCACNTAPRAELNTQTFSDDEPTFFSTQEGEASVAMPSAEQQEADMTPLEITEDPALVTEQVHFNAEMDGLQFYLSNAEGNVWESFALPDDMLHTGAIEVSNVKYPPIGGLEPLSRVSFDMPYSISYTFTSRKADEYFYIVLSWGEFRLAVSGIGVQEVRLSTSGVQLFGESMNYLLCCSAGEYFNRDICVNGTNERNVKLQRTLDGFVLQCAQTCQLNVKEKVGNYEKSERWVTLETLDIGGGESWYITELDSTPTFTHVVT